MSLTTSETGGSFKQLEPGNYAARCVKLIDIGTQRGEYKGEETVRKQIIIAWELPEELIRGGDYDGKPASHSEFYTNSLNEKAKLREHLQGWRGKLFTPEELKGFLLTNILGHPCELTLGLKESGKIEVKAINRMKRECPPQVNPSLAFDLDEYLKGDPAQDAIFTSLSDGYRNLIKKSDEYQDAWQEGRPTGDELPDIPF
jgi:hypothetical protein